MQKIHRLRYFFLRSVDSVAADLDVVVNDNVMNCSCGDDKYYYRCRRHRPVVYLNEPKIMVTK